MQYDTRQKRGTLAVIEWWELKPVSFRESINMLVRVYTEFDNFVELVAERFPYCKPGTFKVANNMGYRSGANNDVRKLADIINDLFREMQFAEIVSNGFCDGLRRDKSLGYANRKSPQKHREDFHYMEMEDRKE